jgi:hypothetical protein
VTDNYGALDPGTQTRDEKVLAREASRQEKATWPVSCHVAFPRIAIIGVLAFTTLRVLVTATGESGDCEAEALSQGQSQES